MVNRLKGAESRDWMASQPAVKKNAISNSIVWPELVDVVANILGVWRLIVSYLNETGRKDNGDSLVVRSTSSEFYCHCFVPMYIFTVDFWKKKLNVYSLV